MLRLDELESYDEGTTVRLRYVSPTYAVKTGRNSWKSTQGYLYSDHDISARDAEVISCSVPRGQDLTEALRGFLDALIYLPTGTIIPPGTEYLSFSDPFTSRIEFSGPAATSVPIRAEVYVTEKPEGWFTSQLVRVGDEYYKRSGDLEWTNLSTDANLGFNEMDSLNPVALQEKA